jgi:hypothetical protein
MSMSNNQQTQTANPAVSISIGDKFECVQGNIVTGPGAVVEICDYDFVNDMAYIYTNGRYEYIACEALLTDYKKIYSASTAAQATTAQTYSPAQIQSVVSGINAFSNSYTKTMKDYKASNSQISFEDWITANTPDEVKAVSKACECGSESTYGKNVDATMHSTFCPKYLEAKKEVKP